METTQDIFGHARPEGPSPGSGALIVSDLTCQRGELPVLTGVTFRVEPGQALILRGPNGTGKTTLLRCLAGLTPPRRGKISLDRDAMTYAAHADGLKAQMTVAENLRFWAAVHGTLGAAGGGAEAIAGAAVSTGGPGLTEAAIDAFDLQDLRNRPAGSLSAGQKRRLGLARLLVTGARVWLLDEPTVSLDTASVERFAAIVRAHLERGGMAVIATHIDLRLPEAEILDVGQFRAAVDEAAADDPFLDAGFDGDHRNSPDRGRDRSGTVGGGTA